jgi:large repetitive protein
VRRSVLTVFSASALVSAAWAVPLASPAAAASTVVKCGQTVTHSIRLANNLVNCPGDGLVIGAAHITVDLAGHTISGVNARGSEGIADDGHKGVRIQNGTIQKFFLNGIGLRNAPGSVVYKVTIRKIGAGGGETDASAGVQIKNSPYTSVVASTVSNDVVAFQSDGVDVLSSPGAILSGNRLAKNSWNGSVVIDSPGTHVIGNTLVGNQHEGIEVNAGSDRVLVAWNRAENNVSDGVVVGAISKATIEFNTLTGNHDTGLFMFDLHNSLISHNRAGGNGTGIDLEGGQFGSTGNQISNNDTSGNFTGLVVGDAANHNVIEGNISNANKGKPGEGGGIIVASATGNTVRGNFAIQNRGVGIGVFEDTPGDAAGNKLARNVVIKNRAHGIDAVAGTIDGGGNLAFGNTPLPNCLGVSCA